MQGQRAVIGGSLAAAVCTAGALLVRRGRRLGATVAEASAPLPGDGLLEDAGVVTTRAVTIAARPEQVWPWLVQMGYGRGGWYSLDRLEKLIGAGDFLTGGSADRIVPELQDLAVGDRMPLRDQLHLVVAELEAPRSLVLVLPDAALSWVWSFSLHEVGAGPGAATRLLIRTRIGARRPWVGPLLAPLDAGHAVMEAVQLQRLRRRVEAVA